MNTLKEWAQTKYQISVLTNRVKDLEKEATEEYEELEKQNLKPEFDYGTAFWTTREKWEFSKKVEVIEKKMDKEIKAVEKKYEPEILAQKDKEVHDGIAKQIVQKTLSFRSK